MIRIIDNKKIELTNDEFLLYQKICRSYDRSNFKGEELFKDHFETDPNGFIIFVRPPHKRYSSLEVYCFLISLQTNQHLRNIYEINRTLVKETEEKVSNFIDDVRAGKVIISSVESPVGDDSTES